jgi:hypothetical protein
MNGVLCLGCGQWAVAGTVTVGKRLGSASTSGERGEERDVEEIGGGKTDGGEMVGKHTRLFSKSILQNWL